MGRVASEYRIWVADGRVVVRLRTNAPAGRILGRLESLGASGSVDALEADPDMTRVRGGTSYVLTFGSGTSIDEVRALLGRF